MRFEPQRSITRAEFIVMLARALKLSPSGSEASMPFKDVSPGAWYAESVALAAQAKLLNGQSTARFGPSASLSREEMVVLILRAYKRFNAAAPVDAGTSAVFTDQSRISAWAAQSVSEAAALGLISGTSANRFDPKIAASRAEAAVILYNLLNKSNSVSAGSVGTATLAPAAERF